MHDPTVRFDERYYLTGLGPPYERSPYWLGFFKAIADHAGRSLKPHRVLDAGCAMGMLVEAFRDTGVEAWGIDISPFAISKVRPDMRSYCRQGSIAEPISGHYDLVTCIGVLEYMPEGEARPAVANLARVTDCILFSSTPNHVNEPTHVTARPVLYWLKLFAEFGFWPDLEYDASYIMPHAMLLRRRLEGWPSEALTLFSQSLGFRTALSEQGGEIERLKCERRELERRIEEQQQQLEPARSRLQAELASSKIQEEGLLENVSVARARSETEIALLSSERDRLKRQLGEIVSSPAWNLISNYRQWRARQVESKTWFVRTVEPGVVRLLRRIGGASRTRRSPHQIHGDATPNPPPSPGIEEKYSEWIAENEPGPNELRRQTLSGGTLPHRPSFSVIVPVYRVESRYLKECLRSVSSQTYDNWQLCIADACPEGIDNRALLAQAAAEDPRIKLVLLDSSRGISGDSNAALALAEGDYVVLLDDNDVLPPFALHEVAMRISADPTVDLLYSDHDYLDESSNRMAPLFKPDWSPETLLSANYIAHLTVIRRTLFEQLGGFDSAVDSAQDWDFFFRIARSTPRIAHLPKVLYHRRRRAVSTALKEAPPLSTVEAQLHSIQRHLDQVGWPADVEFINSLMHVRWREVGNGRVSIIIPSKDNSAPLGRCVQTVLDTTAGRDVEILIVDGGSTEVSALILYKELVKNSTIRVLEFHRPFNYSEMNNLGAAHASGEYLLFLDDDIEALDPGWLDELLGWAQVKDFGAAGAKLLLPGGGIQHAGVVIGFGGFAGHPFAGQDEGSFGFFGSTEWYRNYLAVTGACMMMRREVFQQVGGFDASFISCGSDVDICLRMQAEGYRVLYNPFARLVHHECATRKGDVPDQDFITSFRYYRRVLEKGDPYWNPNLSPRKTPIALRRKYEAAPLEFARKLVQRPTRVDHPLPPAPSDEDRFVRWFDFSESDIRRSEHTSAGSDGYLAIKNVVWFIPDFENPYYGGICTILRFANYLRTEKGVSSCYSVSFGVNSDALLRKIRAIDPRCSSSEVVVSSGDDFSAVPDADACLATLWTTAFTALKFNRAKRKFYFIQDYEPLFYRAGTASGLVESTYRFGFYGIANTVSLRDIYERETRRPATHFSPCVDSEVFFPPDPALQRSKADRSYRQVFCYTRPNHPRNAFELVVAALRIVKGRMGDRVRIVCAGDEWMPQEYGLDGVVENLGRLDYRRTGDLYRQSDAGVALMFTCHPSYIPFELMACGALVIANRNLWTGWFLKDGENCLVADASATCLAEVIIQGLENDDERARIAARARELIETEHSDWGAEFSRVYEFMCDPERTAAASNVRSSSP